MFTVEQTEDIYNHCGFMTRAIFGDRATREFHRELAPHGVWYSKKLIDIAGTGPQDLKRVAKESFKAGVLFAEIVHSVAAGTLFIERPLIGKLYSLQWRMKMYPLQKIAERL